MKDKKVKLRGGALIQVAAIAAMLVLMMAIAVQGLGANTKTAYTRDGINFVSKERMEENILHEYAKVGDYREVQVPLETVVVNASTIPEGMSGPEEPRELTQDRELPAQDKETSAEKNAPRYPYAAISIALLLAGGTIALISLAVRGERRKRN